MNDKRLPGFVRIGWVFVVLLALAGCKGQDPSKLPNQAIRLLPSDTSILIGFYVPSFAETEAFEKIEQDIMATKGIGDVMREAKVSLKEDVQALYLALPDVVPQYAIGESPDFVTIVETKLPEDFLGNVMAKSEHAFQETTVEGAKVWVNPKTPQTVALVSLPKGYFGFGSETAVRKLILRAKGKEKGLAQDSPLLATTKDFKMNAAIWGVALMTDKLAEAAKQNAMTSGLAAVKHLAWSGSYELGKGLHLDLFGTCPSESDALQLQGELRVLVGMAQMAIAEMPQFSQILQGATVETKKNVTSVRMLVPPDLLSELTDMTRGGSGSEPAIPLPR